MKKATRPNILWIGMDEQNRGTIGAYGSRNCRTPNIDALATESLVFDNAFCPNAVCAPTRASILSGRLPSEGSVISNNAMEWTLPYREPGPRKPLESWAPALRDAGYRTVHVGKWHVSPDCRPSDYGFEGPDWPGYGPAWDAPEFHAYRVELGLPPRPQFDNEMIALHPFGSPFDPIAARLKGPEEGSLPAFLARRTAHHMGELAGRYREEGKPFFLRCEFWGPHIRCIAPEPYASMYDPQALQLAESFGRLGKGKPEIQSNFSGCWGIATYPKADQRKFLCHYYAYTTCIDTQIGFLIRRLEDLGIADNTIVIFTTDHGDMLGAHTLYDKGPFMYDDIYRVPLMVRWPEVVAPGRSNALVYNMDAGAMMWELAGSTPPRAGSARSLMPLVRGQTRDLGRDTIIAEHYRQHDFFPQAMVHSGTDKYIYNFAATDEYYDLQADPHEMHNRIDDVGSQEQIREYRSILHDWMKRSGSMMQHAFERTAAAKHHGTFSP